MSLSINSRLQVFFLPVRMGHSLQDIRALLGVSGPKGPEDVVIRLAARASELKRQVEGVATLAAAAAERKQGTSPKKAAS